MSNALKVRCDCPDVDGTCRFCLERLEAERDEARKLVRYLLEERYHRVDWPTILEQWGDDYPWLKEVGADA